MKLRYAISLILLVVAIPVAISIDENWLHLHFRAIPLQSISSTIPQKSLTEVSGSIRPKLEKVFGRLDLKRDVFLVRGNDLTAAVDATARRMAEDEPADIVIAPKGEKGHKDVWLAIYIGNAGSSPPRWQLQSVRMEGRHIRARFLEDIDGGDTDDIHSYWAWAPLGELSPGTYSLSLVNTSTHQTVSRSVVVTDVK